MSLRLTERSSIRQFLIDHDHLILGDVLDYGCGEQPYRPLIEVLPGVTYHGYDNHALAANVGGTVGSWATPRAAARGPWDTVVCTQVIQYTNPAVTLRQLHRGLQEREGWLLITGPTNWPVIEKDDLERLTPEGAKRLMNSVGFKEVEVETRAEVEFEGERWALGWGAVGQAR